MNSNYGVRKERGERKGRRELGIKLYFGNALRRSKSKTFDLSPSLIFAQ
jgi:hypothetical protein